MMWPPVPRREWRSVRHGGPLHFCEEVTERGRKVWQAMCGLWARSGYVKFDDPVHGRDALRCRDCIKKDK